MWLEQWVDCGIFWSRSVTRLIKKRQTDLDLAQTLIIFGKQVGLERRFAVFSGRLLDDSAAATPLVEKADDRRSRFVVHAGEGNLY